MVRRVIAKDGEAVVRPGLTFALLRASKLIMALKGPSTDPIEVRSWAHPKKIVPVEYNPNRLNSDPACMALMAQASAAGTARVMITTRDNAFFTKFQHLGLTLVYDEGTAYNELLQIDDEIGSVPSPYRKVAPS